MLAHPTSRNVLSSIAIYLKHQPLQQPHEYVLFCIPQLAICPITTRLLIRELPNTLALTQGFSIIWNPSLTHHNRLTK